MEVLHIPVLKLIMLNSMMIKALILEFMPKVVLQLLMQEEEEWLVIFPKLVIDKLLMSEVLLKRNKYLLYRLKNIMN